MQTQAKLQVLPVVSDIGNFNFAVIPSAVVGGVTSNKYAATSLSFNPSTNVITMNVLSTVSHNTITMNVLSSLYTGSVNVSTGSNVFIGSTRVESQIPHPFLLSFL